MDEIQYVPQFAPRSTKILHLGGVVFVVLLILILILLSLFLLLTLTMNIFLIIHRDQPPSA